MKKTKNIKTLLGFFRSKTEFAEHEMTIHKFAVES